MVLFFKSMSNYEISAYALFASFMLTAETKMIEKELELTSNSSSISAILTSPFETRVLAPDIQLIQLKLFSEVQLKPWTSRPLCAKRTMSVCIIMRWFMHGCQHYM